MREPLWALSFNLMFNLMFLCMYTKEQMDRIKMLSEELLKCYHEFSDLLIEYGADTRKLDYVITELVAYFTCNDKDL